MDRHQADRVDRRAALAEQLVLVDPELVAALLVPVQQHRRPLAELSRDPRLVPPDRQRRPGLVEDPRLDLLAAAVAHRPHADRAHRDRDRRLLPHADRRDAAYLAPVAVGVRQVLDQVAMRRDPERGQPLRRLLGDRQRLGEQARAGDRPRPSSTQRLAVESLSGAEGPHSAQRSHHQAGCPPSWKSSSMPSGDRRGDGLGVQRRAVAGDAGDQLGAVGERGERPGEGRRAVAPGDQLVAAIADRVADREAAVAGRPWRPGRRRRPRAQRRASSTASAFAVDVAVGVEGEQRGETLLGRACRHHAGRAARASFAASLGGHDHVRAVRQHEHLVGRGRRRIAASSSAVDGFIVGPPSTTTTPSSR